VSRGLRAMMPLLTSEEGDGPEEAQPAHGRWAPGAAPAKRTGPDWSPSVEQRRKVPQVYSLQKRRRTGANRSIHKHG